MPAGDDAFVSLARVLYPPPPHEDAAPPVVVSTPPAPSTDFTGIARDVRVFRAQLADAFDAARDTTIGKAARATLAREIDVVLAALLARLA